MSDEETGHPAEEAAPEESAARAEESAPVEEPPPRDHVIGATVPAGGWDFALMVATLVLLAALGVQSIIGTGYSWWAERTIADWEKVGYVGYVAVMNAIAAPLVVALVVVLGLCVPRRILTRRRLLGVSVGLVVAGLVGWLTTGSPATGLGVYLVLASLLQAAVVVMTLMGARSVTYLTEGRLVKTGSGLLHMGFLVFALVVVSLSQSPLMLPVFALSALLVVAGTSLSFYAGAFTRRG